MVPELKLNDVGIVGQTRNLSKIVRDDDTPTANFNFIHVAAVTRGFEQHESLLDFGG